MRGRSQPAGKKPSISEPGSVVIRSIVAFLIAEDVACGLKERIACRPSTDFSSFPLYLGLQPIKRNGPERTAPDVSLRESSSFRGGLSMYPCRLLAGLLVLGVLFG